MVKIYRMPNGKKYRFREDEVPAGAVLVEAEQKTVEPSDKTRKPANKARKAVKKK